MKNFMIITIFIFAFLVNQSNSQENSIFIAGQYLKLGMGINQVLNLYKSPYILEEISDDEYAITRDSPPYSGFAVIRIKNNKLNYIRKMWGQFDNNVVEFGNTLNTIISKLNKNGKAVAIVKSSEGAREPNITSNFIDIAFGNQNIHIEIMESNEYGFNVSIFEEITE